MNNMEKISCVRCNKDIFTLWEQDDIPMVKCLNCKTTHKFLLNMYVVYNDLQNKT